LIPLSWSESRFSREQKSHPFLLLDAWAFFCDVDHFVPFSLLSFGFADFFFPLNPHPGKVMTLPLNCPFFGQRDDSPFSLFVLFCGGKFPPGYADRFSFCFYSTLKRS